jgi:hypothetical protein
MAGGAVKHVKDLQQEEYSPAQRHGREPRCQGRILLPSNLRFRPT